MYGLRNYNFETIEAIDLKLFNDHLSKLLAGEEVEIPQFDFIEGTPKHVPITTVHPKTPLIKGNKNPLPNPIFDFGELY